MGGLAELSITSGGWLKGFASTLDDQNQSGINLSNSNTFSTTGNKGFDEKILGIIGLYDECVNAFNEKKLPVFSFRRKEWSNLEAWRKAKYKIMKYDYLT